MLSYISDRKPLFFIPLIIGGLTIALVMAFLFGLVVMVLWNWLMPEIFGLPEIGYWQAWGLVLLAQILFKIGGGGHRLHNRNHDREWKTKLRTRFIRPEHHEDSAPSKDEGSSQEG